ncbi:unnamed protein product [Symbiodinium sp. KB8]|nr:unnamed protein product [Symbiodinium sp. KB8]
MQSLALKSLAPPKSDTKIPLPPPKSVWDEDNTHDPHGHLLSQNKVCGYTLKPGEQRCCELPKDDCHKCCVSRTFDPVEGEPSPDTCRRTCIRMCYKGKLEWFGHPPDHFPRCPDDPDAVVGLYPKNDKDEKLKDKVQIDAAPIWALHGGRL